MPRETPPRNEIPLRRIYTHLEPAEQGARRLVPTIPGALLAPLYWLLARALGGPAIGFHRVAMWLGLKLLVTSDRSSPIKEIFRLLVFPMDAVRYHELHQAWTWIIDRPAPKLYLDVSSPRLLPLAIVESSPGLRALLVNPDGPDLALTRKMVRALGLLERVLVGEFAIDKLPGQAQSFDLITCVSVLEHVVDDTASLNRMRALLAPRGRLLLSVPCAARGFEEYVDYNEYGILKPGEDGFVFGQRFYDIELLEERFFRLLGNPQRMAVFGERQAGFFFENRKEKLRGGYPFWREPFVAATEFRRFDTVEDLPGLGIAVMEFGGT